jgi:hypothetical protein
LLVTAVVLPITAGGEPIQWDGNGHWYELVEQVVSWPEAEGLAESRSWQGNPGYLATITSAEENEFIWNELVAGLYPPLGDPWLGGYQNPDESAPADNWHWVTDEPWDFTNWAPWEPNDYCEPYGEMYLNFAGCCGGAWNDHHSLVPKAFIVEYSDDTVATDEQSWSAVKSLFR